MSAKYLLSQYLILCIQKRQNYIKTYSSIFMTTPTANKPLPVEFKDGYFQTISKVCNEVTLENYKLQRKVVRPINICV